MTRSERKRAAIVEAAVDEFLSRGFRDTSMDRIAERAEVSKRTVYNHFSNKDELFRAIATDLVEELASSESGEFNPEQPLPEQLHKVLLYQVAVMTSEKFVGMSRVLLAEAFRSPELIRETFEQGMGEDAVTKWVRQAAAAGAIEVRDASAAANQLLSLLKGPLYWPLVFRFSKPQSGVEREQIISDAVAMFLGCYGPPVKSR